MTCDTNFTKAKELFFNYGSSKFQMLRDGFYNEYIGYGISKEQEEQWLTELIVQELRKLDINNAFTLFPLWYILESNLLHEPINRILDFTENNMSEIENIDNALQFLERISNTIERISEGRKSENLNLSRYINRLELLRIKASKLSS